MAYSRETKLVPHDDALFRELNGEAVILQLDSGTYFGLDEVGTRIWQLIEEHGAFGKVLEAMLAEYDVDRMRCEADLSDLLDQLREKQLIRVLHEEA